MREGWKKAEYDEGRTVNTMLWTFGGTEQAVDALSAPVSGQPATSGLAPDNSVAPSSCKLDTYVLQTLDGLLGDEYTAVGL